MGAPQVNRRAQRLAQAAALLVGCAVALTACGDDDEEPTASSTTTRDATANDPGTTSALRERFDDLITETLTSAEGLSPAVARCAVDALAESVSDAELREALAEQRETHEAPAELLDAAFDAGVECGDG